MKTLALLGGLALASFAFTPVQTSGPYVDSTGHVWAQLPSLADYTADEFDARFAHEIFTTQDGHQFQIDRPWTPEEAAQNALNGQIRQFTTPSSYPGGSVRASVRTGHPVDEEYRSAFNNNIPSIRSHVISVVNSADAAMKANWGIDLVPTKGGKWDSNDRADIVGLLDEAWREWGTIGQDMMIANSNDPTPGGAIGVAYIGLPRQLVKKYLNDEANIMEHETGHTYTLQHCCDPNCTMQAVLDIGAFGKFHNYQESCSGQNHYSVMNQQKNRY